MDKCKIVVLPGTTYYLGLHRPSMTIYWINMLVDELQKSAKDSIMGLYIHSEYY